MLEQALRLMDEHGAEPHPGVLHMYIHTMEMSPHPERALRACDALRDLVPDAGHLRHMPSHIDVLCGHYYAGMVANSRAILADRKYVEQQGPRNFYTLYRSHNYHFKLYAAMFLGQYHPALQAASALIAAIPNRPAARDDAADGRLAGRLCRHEDACAGAVWQMAGYS